MPINFCVQCGTVHTGPVGARCKLSTASSGINRGLKTGLTVSNTSGTHVRPRATSVDMADFDSSAIEPVQDQEELGMIKSFQDLQCSKRKRAMALEITRLQAEAAAPPGDDGTGGGRGGPPGDGGGGGGGGGGRQQLTQEEIDRELSKWSYQSFFEPLDRKNPTYPEFMYAALRWGADQEEATGDELRRYLSHLSYVARKASVDRGFVPEAHMLYDGDVRAKAAKVGWGVFSRGDTEISMDRYCVVNTESYREQQQQAAIKPRSDTAQGAVSGSNKKPPKGSASRPATKSPPGSNACIKHNYEGGCTESRCRFPHECRKCGDTAHVAGNCKKQ